MKKIYLILLTGLTTSISYAQIPEDAIKLTWNPSFGTARNLAIGGTMVGLGGEITAAHTNPAGLGFYKNGEFVFSPGFNFGKNNMDYRGTNGQKGTSANSFNLGTTGVIFAGSVNGRNMKSTALSLSINKTADFTNNIQYKGYNNVSSGAERYAEEFSQAKQTVNDAIDNKFLSLPTRLALFNYLVDTLTVNGIKQVVAFPQFALSKNLLQENTVVSKGGINELALGIGVNKDEKLFWGVSLGMPLVNYSRETTYKESDTSTQTDNGFAYYNYQEMLKTSGLGFNAKIGIIYRPVERVRFGLTINTPTYYSLTDKLNGTMNVKTENLASFPGRVFANTSSASEKNLISGADNIESKYSFLSPWKIAAGASYVFRETENVKKQRAFIAADIEYVTYNTMRYAANADEQGSDNHYTGTNNGIKSIYRNTVNFKLGGEVKFNTIMVRLGGAYYGNPNKNSDVLKSNRIHVSGGLGYRHKGIFIDATYVHQMGKAIDMPYRLADKANTFANAKNTTGAVMITVGTKF